MGRICLRSNCPNGERKCCLECTTIDSCEILGKCSLDDDNLNLDECSEVN
jgi:hypothetical protein